MLGTTSGAGCYGIADARQSSTVEFRAFGQQGLVQLDVSRVRARRTTCTTADHRWFTMGSGNGNIAKRAVLTQDLQVGEYIAANFGRRAADAGAGFPP
jgi:hypothetical protein